MSTATPASTGLTRRDAAMTAIEGVSTTQQALPTPAEDRGRTTIADRVIAAMAARIISEEPGVGGAARRVLGVAVTAEDVSRAPRVEVTITGEVVSLRVRLSVTYPTPVHSTTDRVRRHLIERIGVLTGKQVGVVDIVVAALHRPNVGVRGVR